MKIIFTALLSLVAATSAVAGESAMKLERVEEIKGPALIDWHAGSFSKIRIPPARKMAPGEYRIAECEEHQVFSDDGEFMPPPRLPDEIDAQLDNARTESQRNLILVNAAAAAFDAGGQRPDMLRGVVAQVSHDKQLVLDVLKLGCAASQTFQSGGECDTENVFF